MRAASRTVQGAFFVSIWAKLDALKAEFQSGGSQDTSQALQKAMEQLIAKEERARPLKVGDVAPIFSLSDLDNIRVSSREFLNKGSLIVTFYRGLWCPYCQRDLRAFKEAMSEIVCADASVVAISHRLTSTDSRLFHQAEQISFPVLEDDTGDVAVEFGLRWPPSELQFVQEQLGTALGVFRDTEPWIVPMQARYVIRRDGVIALAEIAFDYSQRSDPAEMLHLLRQLENKS
jgi:peroxiredoxin